MSKKKTLILGLSAIAVCLLISAVGLVLNRSTKREPTAQEIQTYAPYGRYVVSVQVSEKELILDLCTAAGEETLGGNVYQVYTSDTLGEYLYEFQEMSRIAVLEELLYVQYTDKAGQLVVLTYDDQGLFEKSIYDPETDTLYFENRDTKEVWSKFRGGVQWGA